MDSFKSTDGFNAFLEASNNNVVDEDTYDKAKRFMIKILKKHQVDNFLWEIVQSGVKCKKLTKAQTKEIYDEIYNECATKHVAVLGIYLHTQDMEGNKASGLFKMTIPMYKCQNCDIWHFG